MTEQVLISAAMRKTRPEDADIWKNVSRWLPLRSYPEDKDNPLRTQRLDQTRTCRPQLHVMEIPVRESLTFRHLLRHQQYHHPTPSKGWAQLHHQACSQHSASCLSHYQLLFELAANWRDWRSCHLHLRRWWMWRLFVERLLCGLFLLSPLLFGCYQ